MTIELNVCAGVHLWRYMVKFLSETSEILFKTFQTYLD